MNPSNKPAVIEAQHVCAVSAELGEGPVWVARDAALWFVDIRGRLVRRYDPVSGEHNTWAAPSSPGFVLPVRGGGYLAGLKTGLHSFDPRSGEFSLLTQIEPHLPDNRLNDATVGPDGALWFGSMDDLETSPTGALYRYAGGSCSPALDRGYVITNGPAFSPDGRVFYHTDTVERVVYAFDHAGPGKLTGRRVFVRIAEGDGHPDGTVVDAEGCVWIALWGGWSVRRYSPAGEHLATVRFGCANVTKIAFAGEDRRTAYATTAWKGLTAQEHAGQPQAGDLFQFRTDVPGQPYAELVLS
jgi:sugar lactone lactonase YvrE